MLFRSQTLIARNYWDILDILLCLVIGYLCWRLLQGEYRAWRLARLLLFASPALLLLQTVILLILHDAASMQLASTVAGTLFLRILGAVPLWFLFNTPAVQDYCAVGKPVEVYETPNVFLEQTRATRVERAGSSITRNL